MKTLIKNKCSWLGIVLFVMLVGARGAGYAQNKVNVGMTLQFLKSAQITNLCGTDSVTLMAENYDGQGIVEWQESIDTINWVTIPETVGGTFRFLPTQTKYYRSVIKTSNDEPKYSVLTLVQLPPVSNAGSDRIVGGKITTLLGNQLINTAGEWFVISGDSGVVAEPNNPYSQFSGKYNLDYKLTWALTNGCGQSKDTVTIRFEKIVPKNNFIVVDNTDSLLSDSTEMASGLYRIKFSDSGISPKDSVILIGMRDSLSFLRKVITFTLEDSIYNFNTEQGALEDLFKSGTINIGDAINQGILNGNNSLKRGSINIASAYPTRKTLKENPNSDKVFLLYSGSDPNQKGLKSALMANSGNDKEIFIPIASQRIFELYDGALQVTLDDFQMRLTPNFVSQFSLFPFNFKFGLDNANLKYNYSLKFNATKAIDFIGKEKALIHSYKQLFVVLAGIVPIPVTLNIGLKASCNIGIDAGITIIKRDNYSNNITATIEAKKLELPDFNFTTNESSTSSVEMASSFNGGLHAGLSIGPEISFKIFDVVGPYLKTPLKIDVGLKVNSNKNWSGESSIGLYGEIGAKAIIEKTRFWDSYTLFDYKYSIWGDALSLKFKWPKKLELISGNNQNGNVGQALANPISFKVVNSFGAGVPLVPVRFELENGNGSIQNSVLYTDLFGKVSLNWTLGSLTECKLKAYVLDNENLNIENSPIYVTAYSSGDSNPCANSNLAITIKSATTYKYPSVTGGLAPYTYSINGTDYSNQVPHFDNSSPGNFKVYVKDKNLCPVVRAFTISALSPCANSDLNMDISIISKTIQVTGIKGIPPYTYSIDNQTNFSSNSTFSNLTSGVHTVVVKDSKQCTSSREVEVDVQTTPAIKASYPLNGASFIPTTNLTFKWLVGNYATNQVYDLYLKKGSELYILIASDLNITSYNYTTTLSNSSSYTWKLAVKGSDGAEIDFREFTFTTASDKSTTPAIPALIQPGNGVNTGVYVTFQWVAQAGDFKYDLYLDELNATKLVGSNLTNAEHTINNLISGRTYYWKVKIKSNLTGETATSEIWSFTTNSTLGAATEYWFDDDYGSKIYSKMPSNNRLIFNKSIPTNSLISGLHLFQFRYKDIKGKWSGIVSEFFHKLPVTPVGSPKMIASEYWFDDRFASKVTTTITPGQTITADGGFDVSSLTNGLHSYHVRYKDDAGQWSSVVSEFFQKLPVAQAGSRNITASEYWFDDDYLSKVSATITPGQTISLSGGFDVSKLESGLHSYHTRYKDDAGQWSSVISEFFQKLPATAAGSRTITASEYWFDDGFASKVSTAITPGQTITANGGFDVSNLTNGLHSYHVRYKDDAGQWSSVVSEFFQKLPVAQAGSRNITASEYWFDEDFANKVSATITPGQTISISGGFDVSKLESGLHSYHTRYKDDAGQWSSVVSEFFQKLPTTATGSRTIIASEYWFDDGFASKITTAITPDQTITSDGGLDVSALTNGLHSYHVRYKDDAGQWSSVVSEFFQKLPLNSAQNNLIVMYRYWFDGNDQAMITVNLPDPVTPYQLVRNINTCGLTDGDHTIHFQFKDSNHLWSAVTTDVITKSGTPVAEITANGAMTFCQGNSVTLTSSAADSYLWNNGATTQSIVVAESGNYTVTVNKGSGCELSSAVTAIVVNPLPKIAGVISGKTSVAKNQLNVTYSVPAIANAGSYTWTLPDGATGTSTTNSITVSFGNDAVSGNIKVKGHNDCGEGPESSLAISVVSIFTQDIPLNTGWNIISANLIPSNLDMKTIFQPLIDAGKLKKVMDEAGKTIENFGAFGGWKNNIGNLNSIKGYKVNVTVASILSLEGTPLQLPLDIALNSGWNIISYPSTNSTDAKALFQTLIDAGKLKKVMDEAGKTIENFGAFGGWKNNIGNFMSGKGYKVNVTANCTLTIPAEGTKSANIVHEVLASSHFPKVYIGNGTDHMNIHLVNLLNSGLQIGDEIGIFDGFLCVGSATIGAEQLMDGSISIPASAYDGLNLIGNGFNEGHSVELRVYRGNQTYQLNLEKLSGTDSFEKNGSLFAKVNINALTEVQITDNLSQFKCYPNPFAQEITIEVQNEKQSKITVEIYNMVGQLIKKVYKGGFDRILVLKWNGTNDSGERVSPGVYLCKVNGQSKQVVFEGGKVNSNE